MRIEKAAEEEKARQEKEKPSALEAEMIRVEQEQDNRFSKAQTLNNRMSNRMSIKLTPSERADRDKAERDKLAEFTQLNPRRTVRQSVHFQAPKP